jgi:hypothetical protein
LPLWTLIFIQELRIMDANFNCALKIDISSVGIGYKITYEEKFSLIREMGKL